MKFVQLMHLSSIPKELEYIIWKTGKKKTNQKTNQQNQTEVLQAFVASVFSKLQLALNLTKPDCLLGPFSSIFNF